MYISRTVRQAAMAEAATLHPSGIVCDVYWAEVPLFFSGSSVVYSILGKISNLRWQ